MPKWYYSIDTIYYSDNRQETLAIHWVLKAATKQPMNRKGMSLDQCLYDEILDASQKMLAITPVRRRVSTQEYNSSLILKALY